MTRRTSRGFVPRAGAATATSTWGWDVALAGWSGSGGVELVAVRAAATVETERSALTRAVRRFAKRAARVRVARSPGPVRTERPVGTRMGKGKGKPAGHRGWTPRGAVLFDLAGPRGVARRVALITKRSSTRAVTRERFY